MGKQIRPARPTRRQKEEIKAKRLNPDNWLVAEDKPAELVLVSKDKGKPKVIRRGA
jgi:sarcosine oxidase gamma subunit